MIHLRWSRPGGRLHSRLAGQTNQLVSMTREYLVGWRLFVLPSNKAENDVSVPGDIIPHGPGSEHPQPPFPSGGVTGVKWPIWQ